MSEQDKSFSKKYLDFLIENKYWPTQYSYGITSDMSEFIETGESIPATENTYEVKKLKRTGNKEMVCRFEIGYMCSLPIKVIALESYTRMIKFKVEYFDFEDEFNVYAPTNVSPEDFYNRVMDGLSKIFFIRTGHEYFETFKNYHNEQRTKLFNPLGKS